MTCGDRHYVGIKQEGYATVHVRKGVEPSHEFLCGATMPSIAGGATIVQSARLGHPFLDGYDACERCAEIDADRPAGRRHGSDRSGGKE